MLQAKELRFGNKVQSSEGEVITVQQILGHTVIYDSHIKVNRELATTLDSHYKTYTTKVIELVKETSFQDLQPIALTPKVLEKCGMKRAGSLNDVPGEEESLVFVIENNDREQ